MFPSSHNVAITLTVFEDVLENNKGIADRCKGDVPLSRYYKMGKNMNRKFHGVQGKICNSRTSIVL